MYLGLLSSKGSIIDWDRDLTPKGERIDNGVDYDSSAIQSVDYDGRGNAKVQYTGSNKQYDFPMTDDEFEELKSDPSKGSWMYHTARRY